MTKRANDEGSVWLRKDGRWCAAYFVPVAGGGRRRKYVYGKTRKEAHDRLVEMIQQVNRGIPVPVTSQSVGDHLEAWLTGVARNRVGPKTYEGYEANIRLHITPRIGRRRLARLTAQQVRLMLDDLRAGGASDRLIQSVHATLRTALEHAVREEVLARNVAKLVQVGVPRRAERKPLTVDEAKRLLRCTRDHRLCAMFVITLLLGLRRGEVLGLRWEDVDLDARVLRVRQTLQRIDGHLRYLPPKTSRSRRTVPVPGICVAALRERLAAQSQERLGYGPEWTNSGLVFTTRRGTPIEPRNYTRDFRTLCEQAGVPTVRLHDLRHTCVSLLLALGTDPRTVMEIVGHSALDMTMNVYGHVELSTRREALDRLDDLLDG